MNLKKLFILNFVIIFSINILIFIIGLLFLNTSILFQLVSLCILTSITFFQFRFIYMDAIKNKHKSLVFLQLIFSFIKIFLIIGLIIYGFLAENLKINKIDIVMLLAYYILSSIFETRLKLKVLKNPS